MPAVNLSCEIKGFAIGGKHTEQILTNLGPRLEGNDNSNLPSPPAETSVLALQPTPTQTRNWIIQESAVTDGVAMRCSCLAHKVPFASGQWNFRNGLKSISRLSWLLATD